MSPSRFALLAVVLVLTAAPRPAAALPPDFSYARLENGVQVRTHGLAQAERDAQMARGTTDWSLDAVAWLYGHDAERLEGAR